MVERCRFPLHSSYFALHLSTCNYIIHLRPDALSFLTFCFEHFNVAFPSLSRQHTILVDNLPTHSTANIDNCCLILPPFTYLNVHDNILHKLLVRVQSLLQGSEKTKPLRVTLPQLKSIEKQSPTNDQFIYPNGYVNGAIRQHFTRDTTQLKLHQPVLVPHDHYYRRGTILKLNHQTEMATVCITGGYRIPPKIPPQGTTITKKNVNKHTKKLTNTRKKTFCMYTIHVPYDRIVDVRLAEVYGVL